MKVRSTPEARARLVPYIVLDCYFGSVAFSGNEAEVEAALDLAQTFHHWARIGALRVRLEEIRGARS